MNPTIVITNKSKLIHLLKQFKQSLINNPSPNNRQGMGYQLLELAKYDNKLGQLIDTATTQEYIYPSYHVGDTEIVESDDNGDTYLVTANTLINTINDILYDLD